MSPVKSRKTTKAVPTRVLTMVAMIAIMVGALFWLITGSWIAGGGIGVAFAAGLYFAVIYQARNASVKVRKR